MTTPQSPQKTNPLIPPDAPRDPATQRLIDPTTNKVVGSATAQFYEDAEIDPRHARLAEIEKKLDEWRCRGQLWTDYGEEDEVTKTLEEYEALQREIHPQLSDPLSFHGEWDEEVKEEDLQKNKEKAAETNATDARDAGMIS